VYLCAFVFVYTRADFHAHISDLSKAGWLNPCDMHQL